MNANLDWPYDAAEYFDSIKTISTICVTICLVSKQFALFLLLTISRKIFSTIDFSASANFRAALFAKKVNHDENTAIDTATDESDTWFGNAISDDIYDHHEVTQAKKNPDNQTGFIDNFPMAKF